MKMLLMKWFFLLLALPAIEGSLKLWKPKDFSVEERVTKKILETCYGDNDFEELIFILGDYNDCFDKTSVIRMNNRSNIDEDYERGQLMSTRVTKVLLIADSPGKLQADLTLLQKSRWWNHMLPFFIIGKNDEKCQNFKEILNTTWRMDIINSIYICSESKNTILYTLNPITNYAPNPWKRMEDLRDSNIYHQVFDPYASCNNLNYDKTKVLNGYQIKAIIPLAPGNRSTKAVVDALSSSRPSRLLRLIISQLNASVMYKQVNYRDQLHHFKKRNLDVTYLPISGVEALEVLSLFPIGEETRPVVLVKSNERTVLYKIRHLWSTQVLCVAAITLFILFFILVMKNGEVTSAMLEIIRFLTYVSIRTDMRGNAFRIYFTTMLIFIVISNGVFQGKIAAFLTKPDKVPSIETIDHLGELGYQFYILEWWYMELLPDSSKSIVKVVVKVNDDDACIDYVLNGTLNACIISSHEYERKHLLKPLDRVSLQFNIVHPTSWKSRRNWPLYERFDYMLMRSIKSGIFTKWESRWYYEMRDKRKADDHELALAEIVAPYRPIELVKLDFVFKLLAIGLTLATFVLIVELKMREI